MQKLDGEEPLGDLDAAEAEMNALKAVQGVTLTNSKYPPEVRTAIQSCDSVKAVAKLLRPEDAANLKLKVEALAEEFKQLVPKFDDTAMMAAKRENKRISRRPGAKKMVALYPGRKRTHDGGMDNAGTDSDNSDDVPLVEHFLKSNAAGRPRSQIRGLDNEGLNRYSTQGGLRPSRTISNVSLLAAADDF